MRKEYYICDRCGADSRFQKKIKIDKYLQVGLRDYYDLCSICFNKFEKWIKQK